MTLAAHFESREKQAHAARLGMWVFLASEVLLFAALFTLFAGYRTHFPDAFRRGVHANAKDLGSINTAVLLVSSALVAAGVHALREGRRRAARWLVLGTIALGGVFLAIKATEYGRHLHEGIVPGLAGAEPGIAQFWTLYYGMTGLHSVHVAIGMVVLAVMLFGIARGAHRLEVAAIYWHLVDLVWIFLWPVFYLA